MKLNKLRISTRLSAVFGLLMALLLAIVTVALMQMKTMRDGTLEITDVLPASLLHADFASPQRLTHHFSKSP